MLPGPINSRTERYDICKMIENIINEFREKYQSSRIRFWYPAENDYALEHCYYMAKINDLVHSPSYYRFNKEEIIASCFFMWNTLETLRYLFFNIIDKCQEHKNVLLNFDNISYGFFIHNNVAYLTIRGWE